MELKLLNEQGQAGSNVAAADTVLFVSATRTWSGLEVASPYKAGQLYNAELRHAREQDALRWHLDASAIRVLSAAGFVVVCAGGGGIPVTDDGQDGQALRGVEGRAAGVDPGGRG